MDFISDFETTTDANDCRVWAAAIANVSDNPRIRTFNTIEKWFKHISYLRHATIYFVNLKFDGVFILYYLLQHNYTVNNSRDINTPHSFYTLIDGQGSWYYIDIYFTNGNKVRIIDLLKKIPLSVRKMVESYGITDDTKGELDYTTYREYGHSLTPHEIEYIQSDVRIPAIALYKHHLNGLTKMTAAGNAMQGYRDTFPEFDEYFPDVGKKIDDFIRKAYRGGWCYNRVTRTYGEGIVYDVNSLYPSRMYYEELPYGIPEYKEGFDHNYNGLYITHIFIKFRLKERHFPFIQLRNSRYGKNTHLSEVAEYVELYVTNIDLELIKESYYTQIEYIDTIYFKSRHGMFTKYVDYWNAQKVQATIDKNEGLRYCCKLMLNSLYGRFAPNPAATNKIPYLNEDGILKFKPQKDTIDRCYTAMSVFITAYARNLIIRAANDNYDSFIYCDTDSLHLCKGFEHKVDIDQTRLGAFKLEYEFERGIYLRQKTYADYHYNSKKNKMEWEVKCAGMSDNIKSQVTPENFRIGAKYDGKLLPKIVKNGVILAPTTFQIK